MPKVIQTIKSNSRLHRVNPYSYPKRFISRCSSTYIKNRQNLRTIGISASAALSAIMTLAVSPIVIKSSTAEATGSSTGTESKTTIDISDSSTASVNLSITDPVAGTFVESSDSELAKFGVTTTNYTGYTLTISSPDGSTNLSSSTGSKFTTINKTIDRLTFDTSDYNGKWGYKPSKINSVDNVAFFPSPTADATTLDTTSEANTTANEYTIGIGVRADASLASGTYSHTFSLAATANPTNYSITYLDDTGDTTVKNIPDPTYSSTTGTSIKLSTIEPSRTGYSFNGWCTDPPVDSGVNCYGDIYGTWREYPIGQTTANNIELYATWELVEYKVLLKPTAGIKSITLDDSTCTKEDSESDCTVDWLNYGGPYALTATLEDGYTFAGWSNNGAGEVADLTSINTTFTVGEGDSTITALASGAAAQNVKVNFSYAGGGTAGVSSVTFKETATGTTVGTVSTSGGTVKLNPGVGYTMSTTSATNYGIKSYALNNASYGTLSYTNNLSSSGNTTNYFTPNSASSNAEITINTCMQNITGTMQGYSVSPSRLCDDATGELTDSRDGQVYTVAKIIGNGYASGGTIWMTRNLAIGCNGSGSTYGNSASSKSLTGSNSNVSTTWATPTATLTSGDSYTTPYMTCSSTYGAYYNYAAATAGTVAENSITSNAAKDICPSGWQMPNLRIAANAIGTETTLRLVQGGWWESGWHSGSAGGYWWLASSHGAQGRYHLGYNGSLAYTLWDSRAHGIYVRCVLK